MKSLADFLHLRNPSTSSTSSSTSSKSFSNSPRKDSSAESSRQPTRRHTPAQSMSSVANGQIGADNDSPERPNVRQRAASTGLAQTARGVGNMSTPNLPATASVDADARKTKHGVDEASRRTSGGSSSASRSTRRGGSGSASGFLFLNGGRPPQENVTNGRNPSIGPPVRKSSREAPTFPMSLQRLHDYSHSTSSIPRLPPSDNDRRSIQSMGTFRALPSPTGSTFSTSGSSTSSASAAIALRRRSRARSCSLSVGTMSLNVLCSGELPPTQEVGEVEGLALPPQKPAPIGVPLPATPLCLPSIEATADAEVEPVYSPDDGRTKGWLTLSPDEDGRTMSSYASCSTIRAMMTTTTPLGTSPGRTIDSETTPTPRNGSTMPSHDHPERLDLTPTAPTVPFVQRHASSVSFWKDGLVNELDGIWSGGSVEEEDTALSATDPVKARRRRGMATPPTTPIIPSDPPSSHRATEVNVFPPPRDHAMAPRQLDYETATAHGGYLEVAAASSTSPTMPNSVSDISLTDFKFPMPPTHTPFCTPRSVSQTSLDKELPELPQEGDERSAAAVAAGSRLSGPSELPRGSRTSISSEVHSSRSSVSSAAASSDMSDPWRRRRELSLGSMSTSLSQLGFPSGSESTTSNSSPRMRSPTWSSTSDSVGSPRTPAALSFDSKANGSDVNVAHSSMGSSTAAVGSGFDKLARLLMGIEGDAVEEKRFEVGGGGGGCDDDDGEVLEEVEICWGEAF